MSLSTNFTSVAKVSLSGAHCFRESLLSEVFSDGITIDEEEVASSLKGEGSGEEKGSRKRRQRGSYGDEPTPKRKKVKSLKNHVHSPVVFSIHPNLFTGSHNRFLRRLTTPCTGLRPG